MNKTKLIIGGIVFGVIIMVASMFISTNNRAINAEEQINSAKSTIEVYQKRRVDLIFNLVDTVEAYADYEKDTLKEIVEARVSASSGDVTNAQMALNVVAEQYPELKANEQYKQLMTELSVTENMMAQQRDNYNQQIKSYKKLTRKFPNSLLLSMTGYEVIGFEYLEFDAPVDAPKNLFGGE